MKNNWINTILLALMVFLSSSVLATKPKHEKKPTSDASEKRELRRKAAGCTPAETSIILELNNVRAMIETGGNMWQNRGNGSSGYEVPKGSGNTAIFSGALWLGGKDVNDQLKLAAIKYRQKNDFWPGPLSADTSSGNFDPRIPQLAELDVRKDYGKATIDQSVCSEYDRFFEISRQEVIEFRAWYNCKQSDNCNANEKFPNYAVPKNIIEWPAHGDVTKGQDYYLAPFFDKDKNGKYEPSEGDYPWYDLDLNIDCRNDRRITLFGDKTLWWVFNDKGNIHSESKGEPIGMEIRAQAFAFTSNDEINNMTFYNYELINRSTQTLTDTYFGQYIDPDLGCQEDDYVGCDVSRGLGFCYNGAQVDGSDPANCTGGVLPYGNNPPAIGIDFFEGPYQDADSKDNPLTTDVREAIDEKGIPYRGLGVGYGDGIIDNERFGMRRFVYYNNDPGDKGDPETAEEFYNYLTGKWRNNQDFVYGGDGFNAGIYNPPNGLKCDFMFPGDSDPLGFGTGGVQNLPSWDESSVAGNAPDDRRFLQAAGPFTLEPGAVNNITVGVVYARDETGGGLLASVNKLKIADDKAQRLFDACFEVIDGPDAPELDIQELENQLILTITNPPSSNNFGEVYIEKDEINIVTPDSLLNAGIEYDDYYRFQGYLIYQVKNVSVSAADLENPDLARLIAQCDLKDSISRIINYNFDPELEVTLPALKVEGTNDGIKHSFKITDDAFAQGVSKLVNFKRYHFMAIAYAYNSYKPYKQEVSEFSDGQKIPFISSRKSATSGEVPVIEGIPHSPRPEADGTFQKAEYGDSPAITRIEGQGNGGLILHLSEASEEEIVLNGSIDHPTYQPGFGPVDVKIIDPLNVVNGKFRLTFIENDLTNNSLDSANWELTWLDPPSGISIPTVYKSERSIEYGNEQIIPELGISLSIKQYEYPLNQAGQGMAVPLTSQLIYKDSSKRWLTGLPDKEGINTSNWIRSGTLELDDQTQTDWQDYLGRDNEEIYEGILGGTWAPFYLVASRTEHHPGYRTISSIFSSNSNLVLNQLDDLQSVEIVFTPDKTKWSRCPVFEMQDNKNLSQGKVNKLALRDAPSLDREENSGTAEATQNNQEKGMSYFPGYAIDLETGQRLNIGFGEDSWLARDNGRDMIWNPTSTIESSTGDPVFGGKHFIYIFRNDREIDGDLEKMPGYDGGAFIYDKISARASSTTLKKVFQSAIWAGIPLLEKEQTLLSTEARVRIRVGKAYQNYEINNDNAGNPMYEFGLGDVYTEKGVTSELSSSLDQIRAVPNPYYGFSEYEQGRLDNRIKLTNLPERCEVTIIAPNGGIIRKFKKDNQLTFLDWDLKNEKGIPVAGGVYLIHIKADGVGEKIVKWFGVQRPPDLKNF